MDLSILCPAIRSDRWLKVYESCEKSCSRYDWELVLVTERELPEELKNKKNIKVIFSERGPMQKQQQGLIHTSGKYITIISDDSLFLPDTLNKTLDLLKTIDDYKTLIVLKYLEGDCVAFPQWYLDQVTEDMRFKTNWDFMKADKYYWSDTHNSSNMWGIPYHSPILSCAVYTRQLLIEVGGWDACFSSQAIGNVDLSARLMWHGCKYIIQDFIASTCGYYEQDSQDHGAIHYCQIYEDQPLIEQMYKTARKDRIFLDINNWEKSEPVWKWKDKSLINKYKAMEAENKKEKK